MPKRTAPKKTKSKKRRFQRRKGVVKVIGAPPAAPIINIYGLGGPKPEEPMQQAVAQVKQEVTRVPQTPNYGAFTPAVPGLGALMNTGVIGLGPARSVAPLRAPRAAAAGVAGAAAAAAPRVVRCGYPGCGQVGHNIRTCPMRIAMETPPEQ